MKINESTIEEFAIEFLEKQGYQYISALSIAPDSETPTRKIQ
jgi:type I restriction enzyme R subunit